MKRLRQQKSKVQQRQKRGAKHFPWMRLSITFVAILCVVAGVLLRNEGATILTVLGIVLALLQWLFPSIGGPISSEASANAFSVSQSNNVMPKKSNSASQLDVNWSASGMKTTMAQSHAVFHYNETLVNPDEFYGRVRERDALLKRSARGASTSIVGSSQVGTSWLICYLKLVAPIQLGPQFRVAYLDATSPNCKTKTAFVAAVLKELSFSVANANQGLAKLERVIKSIKAANQTLVICIDGFEGLNNPQEFDLEFFTGLRSLAQVGLVLVVASKEPLVQACPILARSAVNPLSTVFDQIRLRVCLKAGNLGILPRYCEMMGRLLTRSAKHAPL